MSEGSGIRRELERLLAGEAAGLAIDLPPGFGDAAERYALLLLEANARMNLTRITSPDEVARLHLLDALSALPLIDAAAPADALDLGSGGGVPGLVLALARPKMRWTLVDSVRKKADALRVFATALDLANVTVVGERAEVLGRAAAHRGRYGLVTARACAPLPVLAEYALPLTTDGGLVLAWKGPMTEAETTAGEAASARLGGRLELHPPTSPALGQRRFALMHKVGATPERYPRRPGEAARRPLH